MRVIPEKCKGTHCDKKCIVCRHLLLTAWFFTAFRITFFQQPKAKPWDEKSLNSGKSKSCIKDQDKRSHISVYQAGCLSVPRLCQIYWSVLAQGHKTISYIVCTRPEKPKKPKKPKKTEKLNLKPYCFQTNRLNVFKNAFHQPGFLILTLNMIKVTSSSTSMLPIGLGLYVW